MAWPPITHQDVTDRIDGIESTFVPTSTQGHTRLTRSNALTVSHAVGTAIPWETENLDENLMWLSSAPTRVTVTTAGRYRLTGGVSWVGNATGYRRMDFLLLSAIVVAGSSGGAAGTDFTLQNASIVLTMIPGDYLEMRVQQGSGGNLNLNADGTFLSVVREL